MRHLVNMSRLSKSFSGRSPNTRCWVNNNIFIWLGSCNLLRRQGWRFYCLLLCLSSHLETDKRYKICRGYDSRLRWCAAEFKLKASFIVYGMSSHFFLNPIGLWDVFEMQTESLLEVWSLYEMRLFVAQGVRWLFVGCTLPSNWMLRGLR